jgi:hypothetical protein
MNLDPQNIIALGIALGAAETIGKAAVTEVVKDIYAAMKDRLRSKYPKVPISLLEEQPDSTSRRTVVVETLVSASASADAELLQLAKKLISAIEQTPPPPNSTAAIIIKNVEAGNLTLRDIVASGSAVDIQDSRFTGDIFVEGVRGTSQKKLRTFKAIRQHHRVTRRCFRTRHLNHQHNCNAGRKHFNRRKCRADDYEFRRLA